jgi:hypothetical protein
MCVFFFFLSSFSLSTFFPRGWHFVGYRCALETSMDARTIHVCSYCLRKDIFQSVDLYYQCMKHCGEYMKGICVLVLMKVSLRTGTQQIDSRLFTMNVSCNRTYLEEKYKDKCWLVVQIFGSKSAISWCEVKIQVNVIGKVRRFVNTYVAVVIVVRRNESSMQTLR